MEKWSRGSQASLRPRWCRILDGVANAMQQEGKGASGDNSWLGLLSSKGKKRADVEILKCENNGVNAENALGIGEFCRYKYIIYTEVSPLCICNVSFSPCLSSLCRDFC